MSERSWNLSPHFCSVPSQSCCPGLVLLLLWPHWINEKLLHTSLPSVPGGTRGVWLLSAVIVADKWGELGVLSGAETVPSV